MLFLWFHLRMAGGWFIPSEFLLFGFEQLVCSGHFQRHANVTSIWPQAFQSPLGRGQFWKSGKGACCTSSKSSWRSTRERRSTRPRGKGQIFQMYSLAWTVWSYSSWAHPLLNRPLTIALSHWQNHQCVLKFSYVKSQNEPTNHWVINESSYGFYHPHVSHDYASVPVRLQRSTTALKTSRCLSSTSSQPTTVCTTAATGWKRSPWTGAAYVSWLAECWLDAKLD